MTTAKFEEFEIYQLAEKLSDKVWNIVINWDSFSRRTIGAKLLIPAIVLPLILLKDMVGKARLSGPDLQRYPEVLYSKQNTGSINHLGES